MKANAVIAVCLVLVVAQLGVAVEKKTGRVSLRRALSGARQNGQVAWPTMGVEAEMDNFKLVYLVAGGVGAKQPQPWPGANKHVFTTAARVGPYGACPSIDVTKDMCDGAGTYCTIEIITGCDRARLSEQKKLTKAMREFWRAVDTASRATVANDGIDPVNYPRIARLDDVVAEYHRKVTSATLQLVVEPGLAGVRQDLWIALQQENHQPAKTGIQINMSLKVARYGENRNNEISDLINGGGFSHLTGVRHYTTIAACVNTYLNRNAGANQHLYPQRADNGLKGFFTVLGIYYAVPMLAPPGGLVGQKNAWGMLVKNPLSDILRFLPNAAKAAVLTWFQNLGGSANARATNFNNLFFEDACLQPYSQGDGNKNNQYRATALNSLTSNNEFDNIFSPNNNRFANEDNNHYGDSYANPAAPDMNLGAGRKQTHTDNPLPIMRINNDPALVVELRDAHRLKKGSQIGREDVKCHWYSRRKECRKFEFDADGLAEVIDEITLVNN